MASESGIGQRQQRITLRHLEIGAAASAGILLLTGFVRILPALARIPDSYDFAAYYVAARALNAHLPLYDPAAMAAAATSGGEAIAFPRYLYPPFFAAMLRPVALVSFATAKTFWFAFNLICLGLSTGLLARLSGLARRWTLLLCLVALTLPPVYDTLLLGQMNALLLALLTSSLYLACLPESSARREVAAGVLLGAAAGIKLYPIAIGAAYVVRRRWLALLSMAAGVAGTLGIGILAGGGVPNTLRYFNVVLLGLSDGGPNVADQSIWPVVGRLFSVNRYTFAFQTTSNLVQVTVRPIVNAPSLSWPVSLVGAIVLFTFTAYTIVLRSQVEHRRHFLLPEFALIITLILLTFPIVHDHYLTLLLIPIAYVIWRYRQTEQPAIKRRLRWTLIAVCLLLALERYWRIFLNITPSALLLMFGFVGTLVLWLALVRLDRDSPKQPAGAFELR